MRVSPSIRQALAMTALCVSAQALAEPAKIGMITTLSGGGASLGIDIRDGFELAVKERNGQLGGVDVEMMIVDDGRKVDNAKQIATRMVERDQVDVMTGIVWSNLAMAVIPGVTADGTIYISPNAGPSLLAGKRCHPNYFNVAWQNDNLHEAMGQYVTDQGYQNVYLMAPNYPAGKDALAGFKRFYQGDIAGEVYTKLGQVDYAAEIANLRAASPDAVFFFLPGGMGINFTKQYSQAGLKASIPLFGPAFSFDEGILKAVGDAALGTMNTSQYSHDLDNPANRAFAAKFMETYGRKPSLYASQGYDTALLLDSAFQAVGADFKDTEKLRRALTKAEFTSVRGEFRFGNNQHPIQSIYVREVVRDGDTVTNQLKGTVFTNHQDAYAAECQMK
jgi:branched-chain amino acid transport system substrate-binding protein